MLSRPNFHSFSFVYFYSITRKEVYKLVFIIFIVVPQFFQYFFVTYNLLTPAAVTFKKAHVLQCRTR